MTDSDHRPIVLVTGATGNLGGSIAAALARNYRIVGLARKAQGVDFPVFEADFASDASMELALQKFRDSFGAHIAQHPPRSDPGALRQLATRHRLGNLRKRLG